MPSIVRVYNKYKNYISKSTVIRLHGPNRKEIERITGNHWSDIVTPKDAELSDIVKMVLALIEENVEIFINVNNHYEGSAPKTISKIQSLLKSKT
jgi:uncharacterized protein YecE (DUF72 family)